MTEDEFKTLMVETGRARGRALGDEVSAAIAHHLENRAGAGGDGFRFNVLGMAYAAVKAEEAGLVERGIQEENAALFAFSAGVAVMERLRLADVTYAARGPAN